MFCEFGVGIALGEEIFGVGGEPLGFKGKGESQAGRRGRIRR